MKDAMKIDESWNLGYSLFSHCVVNGDLNFRLHFILLFKIHKRQIKRRQSYRQKYTHTSLLLAISCFRNPTENNQDIFPFLSPNILKLQNRAFSNEES